MSEQEKTQTQTQEVNYTELINEINQNKDKYEQEAKLILILHREGKYNLRQEYEVLQGEVIEVKIADYQSTNSDYYFNEDIAVIPTQVPTIIREYEKNGYESSYREWLHVFTGKQWVSLELY